MNALPTGTVTFLFADVEGSTQLVRTAGGAYAGLIADVRRLLRSEIAANGGAEVDATGDEISAVFQEVQPALSSALAGQEKIRDHAWPDGIVVNCICPVSIAHRAPPGDDPARVAVYEATFANQPIARDGDAEDDIAPVVSFLLSDACRYVTGETFMVDGGAFMRP